MYGLIAAGAVVVLLLGKLHVLLYALHSFIVSCQLLLPSTAGVARNSIMPDIKLPNSMYSRVRFGIALLA